MAARLPRRRVGQLDHPRRLGAAGVDAEQAAAADLDQGVLVEDLDVEAGVSAPMASATSANRVAVRCVAGVLPRSRARFVGARQDLATVGAGRTARTRRARQQMGQPAQVRLVGMSPKTR